MESLGRRILLLAGFVLCSASCAVLTLALNLQVGMDGSGDPTHDFWAFQGAAHWNILRMLLHPGGGGDSMKGLCTCISTLKKGRKSCDPACLNAPSRMPRSRLLLHPFGSQSHTQAGISEFNYGHWRVTLPPEHLQITVNSALNVLVVFRQEPHLTCDSTLPDHCHLDVLPQHSLCHCLHHWTRHRTQ